MTELFKSRNQSLILKLCNLFLSLVVFVITVSVADEMVRAYKKTAENFSENLELATYTAAFIIALILSLRAYVSLTKKKIIYDRKKSFWVNLSAYIASFWRNNFFAKHWRGEYSLPRSFWINYMLLNVIVPVWVEAYIKNLDIIEFLNYTLFLLIVVNIIYLFMTVWQVVGVWRSANNYTKRDLIHWGLIAKIVVVLGVPGYTYIYFKDNHPQIREYLLITSGEDPVGKYDIKVLTDTNDLVFTGGFAHGITDQIEIVLNINPSINRILLNSDGGRVAEARKLADLIVSRGLITYTTQVCSSACIIPYSAGRQRLIKKNARLGFHQYSFPGLRQYEFLDEYQKDREFLQSRGIKEEFIERIFSHSPEEMWWPTHEELREASFITTITE